MEDLKAQGLLERVEDHTHSVGICDRCKTIVEPRISTQWFCKMKPLAENAIAAVEGGQDFHCAGQPAQDFSGLDGKYSRLVHFAAILVGAPDSHLALRRVQGMMPARNSDVEIVDGRARAASPPEKCDKCGGTKLGAGSGCAGYVVQFGAVAIFDAGLAG